MQSRNVRRTIGTSCTGELMDELREAFDRFDIDGSGFIEVAELDALLSALGLDSGREEVVVALVRLESKDPSRISRDELEAWWSGPAAALRQPKLDPELDENLRALFDRFDADGNGTIDVPELATLLDAAGLVVTPERIYAAIQSVDADESGALSWPEFRTWWRALHGDLL